MTPHRLAASLGLVLSASALAALGACDDPTGLTSNPSARVTIGDTVAATIEAGGEPHTFTFDASAGDSIALFLHATSGAVSLAVIAPDASTLATLGDTARQGALEERGVGPFAIRIAGTYVVRAAAVGSSTTSFRFRLWPMARNPEHRASAITIGDTIRGEDLETPADVDEFTFQGQQGDELIAYIRSLAPHPRAVISMQLFRTGDEPLFYAMASAMSDTIAADLEARPTGRFTIPQTGEYRIRVEIEGRRWGGSGGLVAGYPRGYELQLRRIVRTPESALGTVTPGDTLAAEAIDYVGDIDELTIAAPNGGEFNVFLERSGTGPSGLTVSVVGISDPWGEPTATANAPGAPLHATATGTFTVSPGATARIRVAANDRERAYRGPYRIFVYRLNRSAESVSASLVLGDSITGETIELPGDVDEFTLTVPETTLANFVMWREATETTDLVRLQLFGTGGGQVTATETYRGAAGEKTGNATGTFKLPSGTYTLRIGGSHSRGSGYQGPYRVQTLAIDPAPESAESPLAFGDTVVDAVDPLGDIDTFTFSGRFLQHVGVRVERIGAEPRAGLGHLMWNARTGQLLNPLWYAATNSYRYDLQEDGEYRLEVVAFNHGRDVREQGPYRLLFDTLSTSPEHHGTAVASSDSVVDEPLDFYGDIDAFVLSGAPGEELNLIFTGPGFYTTLDLFDLDTRVRVDGTASYGHSNVGRFTLPSSGRLGMRVSSPYGSQYDGAVGLYRIVVRRIDRRPESVSAQIEVDSIIDGESIDPDADVDEFTFNGVAGDRVNVYFQTPLGTCCFEGLVLELVNPATGAILGSVSSRNSTQRLDEQGTGPVVLPSTGVYIVRVRGGLDSLGRGQYRLQVKSVL